MNQRNGDHPRRFYRDTERGMIFGVCAGIADYFGFELGPTRVVAVLCLIFAMPATLLVYLALTLLLQKKPTTLYRDEREETFWRSMRASPEATFSNVRHKFREMEIRMQRLERYVTSKRYNLDREFQDLENS